LLLVLATAGTGAAQVVTVEDGSGAGFLFRQGGNCYVILPTHLHGQRRDGIRLGSDLDGGPIGTARVVYIAPGTSDISLGLVRGGLTANCGDTWGGLTRLRLADALVPGTDLMLQRPRQSVFEGRRLQVHSSGQKMIRLTPAPGEREDLFGGTSGAVVFRNAVPVAMVLQAEGAGDALAMRMDVVAELVGAFLDGNAPGIGASETPSGETLIAEPGDPLEAVSWSAHPVEGGTDPVGLLSGEGPWIFELGEDPVELVLRLKETDRLSRIALRSLTVTEHGVPRRIGIVTDASRDPSRPRPSAVPAPEMTPDGVFELRIGERFAHSVTITIHSAWSSSSTIRLDALVVD